jgi:signal peptidase I
MPENDISAESSKNGTSSAAKPKKKRTAGSYALSFFIKTAVTVLVLCILLTFVAGVFVCHTNCAYPSIKDGDLCITYRLAEPKPGTMIAYKSDDGVRFARVIALEGDKVEIFNDYIMVNDCGISENTVYPTTPEGSAITYPYQVPENCVFVMNDFRSDPSDSRTYGGIPLDDVRGTVVFTMRMRGI